MKRFLFVITFWVQLVSQLLFSQPIDSSKVVTQVDSIIKLVRVEIDNENWDNAIAQISLAENLSLMNFGPQSAMIGICYFNRGRILYFKGDYTEAETWYKTSRSIIENSIGKENGHYAECLNNLANLYFDIEEYNQSESLHLEVKSLREKLFGKNHPDYAASLNNLAILYKELGAFEKSELYYLEAKEIQEKKLGKNSSDYVKSVINLANLYCEMGLYEKSKLLFVEAYDISIKIYGKNDLAYTGCLTGMSNLYKMMGNFEEAEHILIEAKSIREALLGKEHSNYTTCVINLANLYVIMGKYEKAEPLYLEAIGIDAKILGKEHPYYAIDLSNLASLYKEIGFFNKAETLYLEAMDIREKAYGKESLYYAESLDHLGILYRYFGNFEKAEPLSIQAKLILEKVLGREHPQYAWSVNNLAALYYSMKNYEKAEALFLEALPIFEKVFGKTHSDYGVMLSNLADLYTALKQFSKAEPFFIEASKIFENSLGKAHAYYTENLNHLAVLYEHTKKFDKAELLLSEISSLDQKRLLKAGTYLSERELGQYISSYETNGQAYCDYLLSIPDSDPYFKKSTLPGLIFNHSLFYKGFLLNSINSLKASIFASPKANEISEQLKIYRRQLSEEYAKPRNERKNVLELEEKENSTEKELARSLVGYSDATQLIQWQDVQAALKQTDLAMEFISFKVNFPERTDSVLYAALLIKPGDKQPKIFPLFEEKSIDSLLNSKSERKIDYVNSLYTLSDRGAIALETSKKYLYEILWKPLEKELGGVKTIYFSPSGLLHRINLDAIPINETETLADRYKLIQVNSTRQLVIPTQIKNTNNDAILYGGIQYEQDSTIQNNEPLMASRSRGELSFSTIDTSLRGGSWNYLAGTDREVSVIEKIMQTNGVQTKLKKGNAATEESFKNIGTNNKQSPRILHISTHGYFFSDPKGKTNKTNLMGEQESVFKISEHPMLRSGLIMAGGNAAWQGKPTIAGREDGILTAYEISQMNLSNTELVVLSACETGLGDIQGNEGVYGLQRAFKIAGAKYLIMSLWQVPDKQTSMLMISFYKKWLENKMTIPDAFHAAQKELRDLGLDPYQWAGFVLLE